MLRALSLPALGFAAVLLGQVGCRRDEPVPQYQRSTSLPSEVFVWQRSWKPEVAAAVRSAGVFTAAHVLACELSYQGQQWKTTVVTPDWAALLALGRPVGVVLRIHASAARTGWNVPAMEAVAESCAQTLRRFQDNGLAPVELQIDYDCPESRLADYTRLVRFLKARHPGTPVCITALPAWLRQPALKELVHESPNYVLQVHSLHLPRGVHSGGSLFEEQEARRAVASAVSLGVPFRVALPTYSCVVEFDAKGAVREVYGEDLPAGFRLDGSRHRVLEADAYVLAQVVEDWRAHAPEALHGIIWYRLPVATDRLNWPWQTLEQIVQGKPLKRGWSGAATEADEHGVVQVMLRQDGEAPDDLPAGIIISWPGGVAAEAADGLQGYVVAESTPGWLRLRLAPGATQPRVWPGQQRIAGWLRPPAVGYKISIKISP